MCLNDGGQIIELNIITIKHDPLQLTKLPTKNHGRKLTNAHMTMNL